MYVQLQVRTEADCRYHYLEAIFPVPISSIKNKCHHAWLLKYFFNLFYVHGCFACMCVCAPHACRRQNRPLSSVELELQTVVRCHVGSGNKNQVLWKSSQWS